MCLIRHRNCVSLFKTAFFDAALLLRNAILLQRNPIQHPMRVHLCRSITHNVVSHASKMTAGVDPQNH